MRTPDNVDDNHVADLTPEALPTYLSIGDFAEQTGFSESVLRVWEQRYGWPKPRRLANGFRVYPIGMIPLLLAIRKELANGKTIGLLLRDPYWSDSMEKGRLPQATAATKPRAEWSLIPQPQSSEAQRLRSQIEQALERHDHCAVARIEAEAMRLRASEREVAVTAVVRYWRSLSDLPA